MCWPPDKKGSIVRFVCWKIDKGRVGRSRAPRSLCFVFRTCGVRKLRADCHCTYKCILSQNGLLWKCKRSNEKRRLDRGWDVGRKLGGTGEGGRRAYVSRLGKGSANASTSESSASSGRPPCSCVGVEKGNENVRGVIIRGCTTPHASRHTCQRALVKEKPATNRFLANSGRCAALKSRSGVPRSLPTFLLVTHTLHIHAQSEVLESGFDFRTERRHEPQENKQQTKPTR